jgi:hypothetical protein
MNEPRYIGFEHRCHVDCVISEYFAGVVCLRRILDGTLFPCCIAEHLRRMCATDVRVGNSSRAEVAPMWRATSTDENASHLASFHHALCFGPRSASHKSEIPCYRWQGNR